MSVDLDLIIRIKFKAVNHSKCLILLHIHIYYTLRLDYGGITVMVMVCMYKLYTVCNREVEVD